MPRPYKHGEAVRIAIMEYTKRLKENGSSNMAISSAICAGLDFLMYYDIARRQIDAKRKTRKEASNGKS